MNPNISALFTFPNKRFPGNPGSRPEPAWSLVPDAIMVNSPFRNIQEMFFVNIKESVFANIQDISSILFKYLQVHMKICICKDSSNLFLKFSRNPFFVRICTSWLALLPLQRIMSVYGLTRL